MIAIVLEKRKRIGESAKRGNGDICRWIGWISLIGLAGLPVVKDLIRNSQ